MKFKNENINIFWNWLIHTVGYALILIFVSLIFPKTVQIDNSYFGIWAILAAIIIGLCNVTIKPVLVSLTIPITALTLGIFYPFINVVILKMTSWILGPHFNINGIFMSFFIAIMISILNKVMEKVIKNLFGRR